MSKFKKKPVVIDAFHWTGESVEGLMQWLASFGQNTSGTEVGVDFTAGPPTITVTTKEGVMRCPPGHWLIRGIAGEFYPCEATIFESSYAPDAAVTPLPPQGVFETRCTAATVQMAKKQYMAYCENAGNKNYRGEECPPWEALPTETRSHWCAATIAAMPHLNVG